MRLIIYTLCICLILSSAVSSRVQSTAERQDNQPGKIYRWDDPGIRKAKLKSTPSAQMPTEAARYGSFRAKVPVRVVLGASGKVTVAKAVIILPENLPEELSKALAHNAVEAALKIKFTPATKDGKPVSQFLQIEYIYGK